VLERSDSGGVMTSDAFKVQGDIKGREHLIYIFTHILLSSIFYLTLHCQSCL
jgi:hypothetical protein